MSTMTHCQHNQKSFQRILKKYISLRVFVFPPPKIYELFQPRKSMGFSTPGTSHPCKVEERVVLPLFLLGAMLRPCHFVMLTVPCWVGVALSIQIFVLMAYAVFPALPGSFCISSGKTFHPSYESSSSFLTAQYYAITFMDHSLLTYFPTAAHLFCSWFLATTMGK